MLTMGLTLKLDDFKRLVSYPVPILLGVFLQYSIMPFLGFAISHFMGLSIPFSAGIALVSCCPGGTASNVLSYIARADVALSVTMTVISTLFAVILTPLLTSLLIGNKIEVNTMGLFLSTVKVIVIPVGLGVILSHFFSKQAETISKVSPEVSVILIILIVASIIGSSRNAILQSGAYLAVCVFILHSMGFLLGYVLSKIIVRDEIVARTISIEVGMQNSGLGVVLAGQNFADPLVAVPSAVSSLFHSLIASVLAGIWRKRIT
jgi:BASS family bile acid:Na+ symporter